MDINKDLRIHIGKAIAEIRKNNRQTQHDISFITGIDSADVSKYETGKINFTLRTLLRFAIALQVHPRELFDFEFDITKYRIEE
ncbi:MAG: helix-turn-helix domain-containing protein [Flavobacteriales bacterium]|nr:helix-turn-helix domain-containing protein [Flavobacteriales bacterium]